jgi:hypothetical protein
MKLCNSCKLVNPDSVVVCKYCKSTDLVPINESATAVTPITAPTPSGTGDATPETQKAVKEPTKAVGARANRQSGPAEDKKQARQKAPSRSSQNNASGVKGGIPPAPVVSQPLLGPGHKLDSEYLTKLGILLGLMSILIAVAPLANNIYKKKSNHQPRIKIVNAFPQAVSIGSSVHLIASAEDADGDRLDYLWKPDTGQIIGDGNDVILDTSKVSSNAAPTEITVNLVVSDELDSDRYRLPLRVLVNIKPVLKSIEIDKMEIRAGEPVKLVAVAHDPDGDSNKMHYEWNCPVGMIERVDSYKTTIQTSGLNIRSAPIFPKVSLTITDEQGESTSDSVTLSITPILKTYKYRRKRASTTTTTLKVDVMKPDNPKASAPGSQPQPVVPPGQAPPPETKPQQEKPKGPSPSSGASSVAPP